MEVFFRPYELKTAIGRYEENKKPLADDKSHNVTSHVDERRE
jgi:hypothetical protein